MSASVTLNSKIVRCWIGCLAVLFVVVTSGCSPTNQAQPATRFSINELQTQQYIDQMWTYTDTNAGGYRSIDDFTSLPSLYTTSWTLRIVADAHLSVPNLAPEQAERWLIPYLQNPNMTREFPPLQTLWLAAHALADLQRPIPSIVIARQLEILKRGDLYTYAPDTPPSWAATQTAVEIMQLAHLSLPNDVVNALAQDLAQAPSHISNPNDLIDTLLPKWELADIVLPEAIRSPLRPKLSDLLQHIHAQMASLEPTGETLRVLIAIQQIASANSILLPSINPATFAKLQTPDGYLSVFANQPVGDPQATYYGLLLHMPISDQLIRSIQTRSGPMGWRIDTSKVDPQSSFYATVISHSLNNTTHDRAMHLLVEKWLAETPCLSDDLQFKRSLPSTAYLLALARVLHIPIPTTISSCLRSTIQTTSLKDWTPTELMWLVRVMSTLNLTLPDTLRQIISQRVGQIPVTTMRDVLVLAVAGRVLNEPSFLDHAIAVARSFQSDHFVFRFNSNVAQPDIRSTTLGLYLTGTLREHGPRAVSYFSNQAGTWITLPQGNAENGNAINLETTYLGFILAGKISDTDMMLQ